MKRFLKNFFNIVLWLIAILALSISLLLLTKHMESDMNDKRGTTIIQIEKKIAELEEKNKQLEEKIEYAQYSAENHIHLQYDVIDRYRYKDTYDWIEIKPKYGDNVGI